MYIVYINSIITRKWFFPSFISRECCIASCKVFYFFLFITNCTPNLKLILPAKEYFTASWKALKTLKPESYYNAAAIGSVHGHTTKMTQVIELQWKNCNPPSIFGDLHNLFLPYACCTHLSCLEDWYLMMLPCSCLLLNTVESFSWQLLAKYMFLLYFHLQSHILIDLIDL